MKNFKSFPLLLWSTVCVTGSQSKHNCIDPPYQYKYPSVNVSVYAESREVRGPAPPGKFFCLKFNAVKWLLRLFCRPKTSLLIYALVLAR